MKPIRLGSNQPSRFYRGGAAIARFRGGDAADDHRPEDWLGSTTSVAGADPDGQTRLGGRFLRDAVAADPQAFLGADHVDRFGADPALLVKLLDGGERLPVHAHPDDAWARAELGAPHGKNEAWLIVAAEGEEAVLHVGFREDVDAATLAAWARSEDAGALLAAMNELPAAPGDCVFVPAGTPHAIGAGVFLVEVQQPSDLSVLLEWSRFGLTEADATLGLGLGRALDAVRRTAVSRDELAGWTRNSASGSVVPAEAEAFFRAEWLRPAPAVPLEAAFSILVVVAGAGTLVTGTDTLELTRGDTILVPHGAGAGELRGELEAIRCLPPRPEERT